MVLGQLHDTLPIDDTIDSDRRTPQGGTEQGEVLGFEVGHDTLLINRLRDAGRGTALIDDAGVLPGLEQCLGIMQGRFVVDAVLFHQ